MARRHGRDSLVSHLRVWIPYELDLDPEQRAVYAAAADKIEIERASEVTVAGRRFRIVREIADLAALWPRITNQTRVYIF